MSDATVNPDWMGPSMTYFCFLESSLVGVQYMQPMDAESVEEARQEAARLMRHHTRAYAAHIFAEDDHVATIEARDAASS